MPLSATEQYLLELINRGRLDPGGEAARYGIDLNAGLAAGTISTAAKQVLAPNRLLEAAAVGHSQWMLEADIFSHTGRGGSQLRDRVDATGYDWNRLGENIAAQGTSGVLNLKDAIEAHHAGLIRSAGHRVNLMNASFTEVGLAQEAGRFAFPNAGELNASLVTEVFGTGGPHFLTGVVYADRNRDGFYSVGEGRGGVSFSVEGTAGRAASTGGYSVAVTADDVTEVTGRVGRTSFTVLIDFSDGNVKLDLVDMKTLLSSADITLLTGMQNVRLLGIADIDATGTGLANALTGNNGDNVLSGLAGADTLDGGGGDDLLIGGSGADRFVFADGRGADAVQGFSLGEGDRLALNDDLWAGGLTQAQVVAQFARVVDGDVVLDFGGGDRLTLQGLDSTATLAGAIDIW
jgi:Ca2+-binding RTX toxin-like protein